MYLTVFCFFFQTHVRAASTCFIGGRYYNRILYCQCFFRRWGQGIPVDNVIKDVVMDDDVMVDTVLVLVLTLDDVPLYQKISVWIFLPLDILYLRVLWLSIWYVPFSFQASLLYLANTYIRSCTICVQYVFTCVLFFVICIQINFQLK